MKFKSLLATVKVDYIIMISRRRYSSMLSLDAIIESSLVLLEVRQKTDHLPSHVHW